MSCVFRSGRIAVFSFTLILRALLVCSLGVLTIFTDVIRLATPFHASHYLGQSTRSPRQNVETTTTHSPPDLGGHV